MRWQVLDDGAGASTAEAAQGELLGVRDVVGPVEGSARMSGLEFMAVTARKVLNRIPDKSPMPFRWTINALA